jgi:hypothetical protein
VTPIITDEDGGFSMDEKFREGSSPLYHRSRYFNPGNMLATMAVLACFAVVVMPSLFTVAPNRRAGLPSPANSAPQAAVSAPVEMSQLTAVTALVETPLPAAVSAQVKTSQPIALAHWLASDLFRPAPAKEFEPRPVLRGRGGLSEPGPRNAAESNGLIEPPTGERNVPVADSEGTRENKLLTDDAVNMSFVGIWAADARACSALDRSGFLLTVIDTDGARAGETLCSFESKRQTKLGWDVVARCSNSHERWTANVSLSVKDNRLSWKSQRGTQTYLRCQREEMMAQAQ